MSQVAEVAVLAKGLAKKFGEFVAVAGIDFEIQRGEIYGFLGPNGSGKTTTMRMLLGLLKPTQGEAYVLGTSVADHPELIRPRVGYMAQQFSLYRDLTAEQNLRFHGAAYGVSPSQMEARIAASLEQAGLLEQRQIRAGQLSGGWRQRMALAAATLHQPQVLFLDEPTAGVDPLSRRAFWEMLYRQADSGVTVFVTTHYMDEAEHCHRLAFIQHGRIIASGTPDQLKASLLNGQILELAPAEPAAVVQVLRESQRNGRLGSVEVELHGSLVHVVGPDLNRVNKAIKKELRTARLDPGPVALVEPSLEDVFIASMR